MKIKLRGLYSVALGRLLLDEGYKLLDPPPELRSIVGNEETSGAEDILVQDRYTLHGVDVLGETEKVWELIRVLQAYLIDTVLVKLDPDEDRDGWVRAAVEFAGASKEVLDKVRSQVVPTIFRHHRLKIIDARAVSEAEKVLSGLPDQGPEGDRLFQELVMGSLGRGGPVRLEHVRVGARPPRPREAVLLEVTQEGFVAKRRLSVGWYDGLEMPIEEGDYAITEVREGAWSVQHTYYSASGVLKGEYHNVNTPVELYPYGARYVDLEVDVVRRPGRSPSLLDKERLELLAREGYVSERLRNKALEVAHAILQRLSR